MLSLCISESLYSSRQRVKEPVFAGQNPPASPADRSSSPGLDSLHTTIDATAAKVHDIQPRRANQSVYFRGTLRMAEPRPNTRLIHPLLPIRYSNLSPVYSECPAWPTQRSPTLAQVLPVNNAQVQACSRGRIAKSLNGPSLAECGAA